MIDDYCLHVYSNICAVFSIVLTSACLPQLLCGVLAGGGGLLLVLVGGALAGVAGVGGAGGVAGPGPAQPGGTQVHWQGHTSSRGMGHMEQTKTKLPLNLLFYLIE